MRTAFRQHFITVVLICTMAVATTICRAADPLPSWNDGPAKQSIISFVEKVTTEGSPEFVPVPERIATFDNDGTLWCEQPMPVQFYFALDRVKALAPQHPEWQTKEPFASLLIKGDLKTALAGGDHALLELIMTTHTGMTTGEFEQIVKDWIATAKHPTTGKLYTEMVYQPMLEVLAYLRANGFKNYIVSGGGVEFMRPWTEKVYGIPPEQVVGSSAKTKFGMRDGKPVIVRLPELNFNDDKADKPIGINQHIGRRPIAAFGNSRGDQEMLEYTQGGSGVPRHPEITAIDILLEPDATMLQHSANNNARLLKVFPKGFALDATHTPHITMIQCFVRTADLDKVYAAEEKVFTAANVNGMKLEAFTYYYAPSGATGVAGICAKPTPEILKLQADIIATVKPFMVDTAPIGAFTAPHDDPAIDAALIQYVSTFVPKMSGENFNPHVSTGVAPREYLDKMLTEPFESFTFSPAGAAVYQLGPFGTAAKKLKEWDLK